MSEEGAKNYDAKSKFNDTPLNKLNTINDCMSYFSKCQIKEINSRECESLDNQHETLEFLNNHSKSQSIDYYVSGNSFKNKNHGKNLVD